MGQLKFTDFPSFSGSSKRTLFITEKLHCDEIIAQAGAIKRDKRFVAPRACAVDRLGKHLLARSRLSEKQNGPIMLTCLLRATDTITKRLSFSSKIGKRVRYRPWLV